MMRARRAVLALLVGLAAGCLGGGEIEFPHHTTREAAQKDAAERGVPVLIDFHAETLYERVWPTVPLDATFPFHFGLRVSPVARRANSMREILLHGWDLAQAVGAEWELPDADVGATARTTVTSAYGWCRPFSSRARSRSSSSVIAGSR